MSGKKIFKKKSIVYTIIKIQGIIPVGSIKYCVLGESLLIKVRGLFKSITKKMRNSDACFSKNLVCPLVCVYS